MYSHEIWVDPLIQSEHQGQRGMLLETLTEDKNKS